MLFPPASELNNRIRRLITSYQRNFKNEEIKIAKKAKLIARREKVETIDVESERTKFRELLSRNHSVHPSFIQQLIGNHMLKDESDRSPEETLSFHSKQRSSLPPPAHQHGGSSSSSRSAQVQAQAQALSAHTLELMLAQAAQAQAQVMQAAQAQNNAATAQAIANSMAALGLPPSISVSVTVKGSENNSSSAPMDLSGGLTKGRSSSSDLNGGGDQEDRKRKLDDSMQPPPPGAEKKRRKLDDIVKGLSAAKGQTGIAALFGGPSSSSRGQKASTSSNDNPLGLSFPRSSGITIMPCGKDKSTDKEDKFSKDSAQAKLQAQVQAEAQAILAGLSRMPGVSTLSSPSATGSRGGAEAPLISIEPLRNNASSAAAASAAAAAAVQDLAAAAGLNKLPDFLLQKLDAYSHTPPHELKVSKWLADQQGITPERPASPDADFLDAKRRRKPRINPALLDWNQLSGDENVSVINRLTGKKITGNKAPHFRNLAQWLLANPMFDVDPKWSDLVKEKGNLPGDLQRRVTASPAATSLAAANAANLASLGSLAGLTSPSTSTNIATSERKPRTGRNSNNNAGNTSGRGGASANHNSSGGGGNSSAMPSTSSGAGSASTSGLNLANFAGLNPNFLSSLPQFSGLDMKNNPLLAAFDPKMFGALDPKTAASLFGASFDPKNNPLAGLDPKNPLLSSLDPKNPLSMFGGFPGLGALGGLGGFGALGNMGAMSSMGPLFSNLAGFLPDMQPPSSSANAATTPSTTKSSASRREDKGKKPAASSSSAATSSSSANANANAAAAAAAASLSFPFLNPSMLYGIPGLGGMGPFSLPAGIPLSTAFSNLGAQGFMNGLTTTTANEPSPTSTKTTASTSQGARTSSSSRRAEREREAAAAAAIAAAAASKEERRNDSRRERSSHGLDLTPSRNRAGSETPEQRSSGERRSRNSHSHTPDEENTGKSSGHKKASKLKLDDGDH